jgi:uncharacterized SAM-binding protein YcdF (DUF218 family)
MTAWVEERRADPALRKSIWRRLALLLGGLASLWLGGFLQFVAGLPMTTDMPDQAIGSDAVVVLTGGAERLNTGIALLNAGKAKHMLISGVDTGTTALDLQRRAEAPPALFNCCIELGYNARDTRGNAIETALWAQRGGYASLRLVTANYHMPRAMLLFHQAMPQMTLLAHPVVSGHVKVENWWRYPGTARLLATEYSKYLTSLIGVRLAGSPDR